MYSCICIVVGIIIVTIIIAIIIIIIVSSSSSSSIVYHGPVGGHQADCWADSLSLSLSYTYYI